ncbi:TPA: hypothetical protein N0F65_013000 [Lagenidium giganteum]|uniref:Uncharacterized protein n=1 Tax=Lagenidium giganteum TaxID=4803 RepID=A0AAV2YMQ9_9STRA|nr:TPA: hypothetical protein N0F65_013000 [Lagenidium giganteum]
MLTSPIAKIDSMWTPIKHLDDIMDPTMAFDTDKSVMLELTASMADAPIVNCDDSPRASRKRQRPDALQPTFGFGDIKLDLTALDVMTAPECDMVDFYLPQQEQPSNVLDFLKSLNISFAHNTAMLNHVHQSLAANGYDSTVALGVADMSDLHHAGISTVTDCQTVYQSARQYLQARQHNGPGDLSESCTVHQWLVLCGIPAAAALEYTTVLTQHGINNVAQLDGLTSDRTLLSAVFFRAGHRQLFLYAIDKALKKSVPPMSFELDLPALQPLGLSPRFGGFDEHHYDSFLDHLFQNQPDCNQLQRMSSLTSEESFCSDSDGADDLFATNPADFNSFSFGAQTMTMQQQPKSPAVLRSLPAAVLQVLYDAVNMPRPNPCRKGKKVCWSVLATGGMNDERFRVLQNYSADELQAGYSSHFKLPSTGSAKSDTWSEENIRQLGKAVNDPRCKHLSKVCWEMLATGRTGVEEYAPLGKFTASQLRSRYRSLFGDKRPQKLRQKKQLMKMQQEQMRKEKDAAPATMVAPKSEPLAL